jgi:hypothetical protein
MDLSVMDVYAWEQHCAGAMYEWLCRAYDRTNLDLSKHASRNASLSLVRRRSFIRGDSL